MKDVCKKIIKSSLATLALLAGINFHAQETEPQPIQNPPVSVEAMPGSRGISFQMTLDKKLRSVPQIGFFSVTDFNSDWGNDQLSDLMIIGKATVDLYKGLKFGAGFQSTPGGIRPSAALIYTYADPDWLIIAMPRADLSANANLEGLGIVEYKPALSDKWRLYTRLQGTYVHAAAADLHTRSYIRSRVGLTYKEFTFGVGANVEYYGPTRHKETNIGGFLQVALF